MRDPGPRLPATSAPNAPPRPCPATVRSAGPAQAWGVPGPPTRPLKWPEGGRGSGTCKDTLDDRQLTPAPPEPHLSPRNTGGQGTARSGAVLPAPARTVKLRRPEVPPPNGVTWRGSARGSGWRSRGRAWCKGRSWSSIRSLLGMLSLSKGGNCGPGRLPPHSTYSAPATSCYTFVIHLFPDCLHCGKHYA